MMQGITTLPGAQQPQQAPGQAAPFRAMPVPQGKTPGIAQTPALSQQSTDALLAMYRNPKLLEGTPYSLYGVIGALSQQLKAKAAAEAAKNNAAMAAYGQQVQQPPVAEGLAQQVAMRAHPTQMARHGGIMHGYSGGGAVAFQSGGALLPRMSGETDEAYAKRMASMPQQPGETDMQYQRRIYSAASRQQDIAPLFETVPDPRARMRRVEQSMPAAETPAGRTYQRGIEQVLKTASRPDTGSQRMGAPAPAAAPAPAKPDRLSEIEKEYEAASQGLQALLGRQGQVDPELARLRQAAYESAQGITERRERDRLAALETAQKAARAPLLENQEALLRMAASLGGAKRFGEGLSRAAGAAGEIRGEQRKALEAAQKVSREEQNAIDQLNQALAEKRVADRSGDVDRQRQAELAVAQAKMNLADKRLGVQKERGTEEDRAAQREIQRGQLRVAERRAVAEEKQIGRDPQDIQIMRALNIPLTPEGYKQYADIAKGYGARTEMNKARLDQRRAELATKEPAYQMARMAYAYATTDEARAKAMETMRRLEELNGIVDEAGAPSVKQPTTSGVARPTTQAEFNALSKGARYINPADGKEYVKN